MGRIKYPRSRSSSVMGPESLAGLIERSGRGEQRIADDYFECDC